MVLFLIQFLKCSIFNGFKVVSKIILMLTKGGNRDIFINTRNKFVINYFDKHFYIFRLLIEKE